MEEIFLDVEAREELGRPKVKHLREKDFIPAVVYAKAKKPQPIKLSRPQLLRLLRQHRLENVVINLKISPKHKAQPCLIKEIQYEPVGGEIIHIDFNEISLTQAIRVNVPVVAKGEPLGVKLEGGSLEQILWEIEVDCLPTDIPKEIEVDVSQLKMGEALHIKDIVFSPKLKVLNEPEAVILSVAMPMKEEVAAAPLETEEKQEPEVIKEKKEVPAESSEEETKKEKK